MTAATAVLQEVHGSIMCAACVEDIFGNIGGQTENERLENLKRVFGWISKAVQPDHFSGNLDEKEMAGEAFSRLRELHDLAALKVRNGSYGDQAKAPKALTEAEKKAEQAKFLQRMEVLCSVNSDLPYREVLKRASRIRKTAAGETLFLGNFSFLVQNCAEMRDSRGKLRLRKEILLHPDNHFFLIDVRGEDLDDIWLWTKAGTCSSENLFDPKNLVRKISAVAPSVKSSARNHKKDWAAIYRPGQKGVMLDFIELASDARLDERFLVEMPRLGPQADIYFGKKICG